MAKDCAKARFISKPQNLNRACSYHALVFALAFAGFVLGIFSRDMIMIRHFVCLGIWDFAKILNIKSFAK